MKLHDEAEPTRMPVIVDAHPDVLDLAASRKQLVDGVLRGVEREVPDVHRASVQELLVVLLL
jgi:hypothetical protein